ncbi:MAG: STAS/SEC14 domain-containing protein [Deltaproteobacteria bacterium]|nr:STAS/SEC14 domain-containing protein [Deltaproteobacteria bacterium]MBW2577210.1 STAS/SEC14 domain-containing protein [Deltaproteobacteria bacterium]MBW2694555.1 STAS/SEC14 domain-containing protein [Deltaproteobacteria bacterium]
MTIHYRIDASSNRIMTRVLGEVTIDEALQHFDELSVDPSYEPGMDALLDLTDCETLLDVDKIRTAAARATADLSTLRFGRMAIVVASEALFGMLRMFHTLSESAFSEVQIFRDRDEALQWLGGSGSTH